MIMIMINIITPWLRPVVILVVTVIVENIIIQVSRIRPWLEAAALLGG